MTSSEVFTRKVEVKQEMEPFRKPNSYQLKIIDMLSKGYQVSEVALQFGVTTKVISRNLERLRINMQVKNIAHMVAVCIREGLI